MVLASSGSSQRAITIIIVLLKRVDKRKLLTLFFSTLSNSWNLPQQTSTRDFWLRSIIGRVENGFVSKNQRAALKRILSSDLFYALFKSATTRDGLIKLDGKRERKTHHNYTMISQRLKIQFIPGMAFEANKRAREMSWPKRRGSVKEWKMTSKVIKAMIHCSPFITHVKLFVNEEGNFLFFPIHLAQHIGDKSARFSSLSRSTQLNVLSILSTVHFNVILCCYVPPPRCRAYTSLSLVNGKYLLVVVKSIFYSFSLSCISSRWLKWELKSVGWNEMSYVFFSCSTCSLQQHFMYMRGERAAHETRFNM